MDPFKLLSRSSNLQKSVSSSGARLHHIPSTADSGNLEKYSGDELDALHTATRVKKRKNNPDDGPQNDDISRKLGYGQTSISAADVILDDGSRALEHPPHKIIEVGACHKALDAENCRRILKQNRLKITLLDSGSLDAGKRRERHKLLSRGSEDNVWKGKARAHLTPQPLQSFSDLGPKYNVSKRLQTNLDVQGYRTPTEVQLGSLPLLLGDDEDRGLVFESSRELEDRGRSDVDLLTIAPTGSGKTLAFLMHLLHGLRQGRQHRRSVGESTRALILAPTHELVDQIVNEGKKLSIGTGIRISRMRKGISLGPNSTTSQTSEENKTGGAIDDSAKEHAPKGSTIKADILVSTPMLLLHAIAPSLETTVSSLAHVRYLVLDEADVLLDPLFRAQTLDVWNACINPNLQASLWSATIGSSIESLAQSFILDRRRKLGVDVKGSGHHILRLVVGLKDSAVPNISHQLIYAATERGKLIALRQMIHPTVATIEGQLSLQPPCLVFTQTIPRAIALHSELRYDIPAEAGGDSRIAVLHSDLSDTARSVIMAGFRKGEIWILITTDLLARGVDFRGINGVVNYDIPSTSALYIHRVGRTGRQGREGGVAVTLYTKEDIGYVKNVANVIAASEKQRNKLQDGKAEVGLQQWLLDALPDISKRTKRELKRRGVMARNATKKSADGGREARRMRISTKSGYDRRLEQKRRDAVTGIKHRNEREHSDEDWEGIRD
ncbi:MAG: hypothetical protein L6R40_006202 [Gallowayella cf. fulva]|nr:MAG: hypothetical protein L6R40_006202 [Xanthomendoza cf. fulva]